MALDVKICGLSTPETIAAAVEGGARWIGLVFYPRSPRAVGAELAAQLARLVPTGVRTVGLFVDPDDRLLDDTVSRVPLAMLQLHGSETPERVAEVRSRYGLPVMKAVKIAGPEDLVEADRQAEAADRLLFDAKPPASVVALPGGNGIAFDWRVLAGRSWPVPWMLSGGLNPDNLAEAVAMTGARSVDVSSGVESRPGVKDPERILRFLEVARTLDPA